MFGNNDLFGDPVVDNHKSILARSFEYPPFSVLNAREGWWQERKRQWLALGIKSEVGRQANLLEFSDTLLEPDPVKREAMRAARDFGKTFATGAELGEGNFCDQMFKQKLAPGGGTGCWIGGRDRPTGADAALKEGRVHSASIDDGLTFGCTTKPYEQEGQPAEGSSASGTSIFDPVLTELSYRWFCPPGGHILDPFAGGSVRGIVASVLGFDYSGFELRPEQVHANREQAAVLCPGAAPSWHCGDSAALIPAWDESADFVFSCPPYGDLEVYSDMPEDISAMSHEDFLLAYRAIVGAACNKLKPNRFAAFVVGDYRCKAGFYRRFVSATEDAFEAAGLRFYNECILVTAVGSLPIRVGKQFRASRKLGKTHQNLLVFCKGDPFAAAAACEAGRGLEVAAA